MGQNKFSTVPTKFSTFIYRHFHRFVKSLPKHEKKGTNRRNSA